MRSNHSERIENLIISNPSISLKSIGAILTADALYKSLPGDLEQFRDIYAHFDPELLDEPHESIMLLELAKSREPVSVIKHRLNSYINIKFNDIENHKTYEQNMRVFGLYSALASSTLAEMLELARLPEDILEMLEELDESRRCTDFYGLLRLFKETGSRRLRYELLRKLGLIVLISRINRTYVIDELETRRAQVRKAFSKGLAIKAKKQRKLYYWVTAENSIMYSDDRTTALRAFGKDKRKKEILAMPVHGIEKIRLRPFQTGLKNEILLFDVRNKLRPAGAVSYTSFIEKMLRKNLEFPNQVRDVIGVRIVVRDEEAIHGMIIELERFLGGASTRKREKNTYHRFGKKKLNRYSSEDYYVWKAVYDITLPHPTLPEVRRAMRHLKKGEPARDELLGLYRYLRDNPRDFVVEVQLQDLKSYLLGIARGSPSEHALLKRNQVMMNTFYKLFPMEVYSGYLDELKMGLVLRDRRSSA